MLHDDEFKRHALRIAEFALERKRAWRDYASAKNKGVSNEEEVRRMRKELDAALSEVALWEERMDVAVDALETYIKSQEAISAT